MSQLGRPSKCPALSRISPTRKHCLLTNTGQLFFLLFQVAGGGCGEVRCACYDPVPRGAGDDGWDHCHLQ